MTLFFGYNSLLEIESGRILASKFSQAFIKTVKFRDYEFPCPNDCDYYLKSIYGNYMRIPKNVRGHGRLNKLRYDDILSQIFSKIIRIIFLYSININNILIIFRWFI